MLALDVAADVDTLQEMIRWSECERELPREEEVSIGALPIWRWQQDLLTLWNGCLHIIAAACTPVQLVLVLTARLSLKSQGHASGLHHGHAG